MEQRTSQQEPELCRAGMERHQADGRAHLEPQRCTNDSMVTCPGIRVLHPEPHRKGTTWMENPDRMATWIYPRYNGYADIPFLRTVPNQ